MYKNAFLVRPELKHAEQIRAYRQEFLDCGDSMDGSGSLRKRENPAEWLTDVEMCSRKETVPSDWVQSTQFIYVRKNDGKVVG